MSEEPKLENFTGQDANDPPDNRGPALIVTGSVLGGFEFYGPFQTIDAAIKRYGESLFGKINAPVTIALLESPEKL